jgi:hypothetical protein
LEDFMGALNQAMPSSVPARLKLVPARTDLPQSFRDALAQGWSIVREESAIGINSRRRTGVVLLGLKGVAEKLRIPYAATAKAWKFEAPEAISAE